MPTHWRGGQRAFVLVKVHLLKVIQQLGVILLQGERPRSEARWEAKRSRYFRPLFVLHYMCQASFCCDLQIECIVETPMMA